MYVALWSANQFARLDDEGAITQTWVLPHGALLLPGLPLEAAACE